MRPTSRWFTAPVLASAFRPFYLLGALYAPLVITGGVGALAGVVPLPTGALLWHGHEMVFGFAMAIVIGTVLTALPSWAGTQEITGARLALLAALWLAGRIAFWASPWLPAPLTAAADLLFPLVLTAMLVPQVLRIRNRLYLLLLPILVALCAAALVYHASSAAGDAMGAERALRAAVYAVVVIFLLKGGVLTPIFTGNALRALGRGDQPPFIMGLDAAALGSVLVLALLDLGAAPAAWQGVAAVACVLVHGIRVARWRGWLVAAQPLLAAMHLSFAWLVFAFALKACAELTGIIPETAWLHAFTVGSLGMMMLGLMNRVVLRHTGRPLEVSGPLRAAYGLMFAAAVLRVAAAVFGLGAWAMAVAAVMWAAPFVIYLFQYGAVLVQPSLPRTPPLQPA